MKTQKLLKITLGFSLFTLLTACDYIPTLDDVVPDKRSEYRKSRSLPDLEVPPDLTVEDDDNLVIPGEEEPTTLTAYELQKKRGGLSELELLAQQYPEEKALPVPGSSYDVWPTLTQYWLDAGYSIDLEDAELGVLETDWRQRQIGDGVIREKYKVFSEPTETGNNTVLFISAERQEKIGLGDTNSEWLDQEVDERKVDSVVAEIKTLFYGDAEVIATTDSSASNQPAVQKRQPATLEKASGDKYFLLLPLAYDSAWPATATLLQRAGIFVDKKDSERGIYTIVYTPQPEDAEEDEGLLDKLKFWGDDEPESQIFQLSLTGQDDSTEIIVLDDEGDWQGGDTAATILENLLVEYNEG